MSDTPTFRVYTIDRARYPTEDGADYAAAGVEDAHETNGGHVRVTFPDGTEELIENAVIVSCEAELASDTEGETDG